MGHRMNIRIPLRVFADLAVRMGNESQEPAETEGGAFPRPIIWLYIRGEHGTLKETGRMLKDLDVWVNDKKPQPKAVRMIIWNLFSLNVWDN